MTDFFTKTVTIYNDITADSVNPRRFDRNLINSCSVQGGFVSSSNGTIVNIVNSQNVITKDIKRYVPYEAYRKLPEDLRTDCYTVKIGDFIVFGEVEDVATTAAEFSQLQQKYKNNGMKVTSFTECLHGMIVDNIVLTNT